MADMQSITELFAATELCPNARAQDLRWKYWEPRADWVGPRSYVLTDEGKVLAHAALIPARCASATQRISVLHLIDWAALPGAAGAGVTLMKQIGRQAQGLLAIGGSAQTLQILPQIGFTDLGTVDGYVRTLSPSRLLRSGAASPARLMLRFARSVLWTASAPRPLAIGWNVHAASGQNVDALAMTLPLPARGMAVLERNISQLRYMLDCPIVPFSLYGIEKAGSTRGYFLLASASGQVRIADCWVDSDEAADWRALILCAVAQAKRDGQAAEVVCWANDPLLAQVLAECGFHSRQRLAVRWRASGGAPLPALPLRLQMLDSDAAYLHEGAHYWA